MIHRLGLRNRFKSSANKFKRSNSDIVSVFPLAKLHAFVEAFPLTNMMALTNIKRAKDSRVAGNKSQAKATKCHQ